MRILIVTLHYLPDGGPSAPLYAMLAEAVVSAGHDVTVIAAAPHYPTGRALPDWKMPRGGHESQNGVSIVRVPIPYGDRARLSFRMLQFAVFQTRVAMRLFRMHEFDGAIFANPALQVWLPWQIARRKVKGPLIFSIHDVYPDVGNRLGIFKMGWMQRIVGALEAHCVRTADYVRILAPAFREPALRLGADATRVPLIYDWVDTDLITPAPRENSIREEFGLTGKFVFLYAGNIGLSQGLEALIETAARFRDRDDVRFVFVGGGAGLEPLRAAAKAADARNVQFIPFQPRARLPEVLAAADVSLITLRADLTDSLPSKVYSIFSSGRPVLASVDARNDVVDVIARSGAGVVVEPENPDAIAAGCQQFLSMSPDEREQMGLRGRAYVEAHHSPGAAAAQFTALWNGTHPAHTRS